MSISPSTFLHPDPDALRHPEGLWRPDLSNPTPGGHPWSLLPLSAADLSLIDAIYAWIARYSRPPTTAEAARAARTPAADTLAAADRLAALGALRPSASARAPRPAPTAHPPRPPSARTPDQRGDLGQTTLLGYHHRIQSADRHFDNVETTVAHAHGIPHPGLGGLPYGARLADAFMERDLLRGLRPQYNVTLPMVEVGPGTGELMEAMLPQIQMRLPSLRSPYVRIDASPALLALQAARMPHTTGTLGDATRLPLVDRSIGFVFANEVIADLESVPSEQGNADPATAALIKRYRIAPLPPGSWYNTGAWAFIGEIARVLRPGGRAWLSEFGGPDDPPEEAAQLDHPEISIHFGHLASAARIHGLIPTIEPLDSFLRVDLRALQPARRSWEGLRAMARSLGRHLPARAWTAEGLAALLQREQIPLSGARMVPLSEEGPGPLWTRFWCITLERPLYTIVPTLR